MSAGHHHKSDSSSKATSGFSLAGSLIPHHHPVGGFSSSLSSTKDASARLREGLSRSTGLSSAAPLSSMASSPPSSPNRTQQQQHISHRKVASYRQSSASKHSPTRSNKRSVSQDPQDSERSSTMRGDSSASCSSPSKTPNSSNNSNGFEDYYSAATPGFKNAFNILGEGPASQNYTSPSSSSSKSPKSTIHTSIDNSSPQKQQLTRSPRSPPLFTKSSSASPPNTPPPTETPSPAASAMSRKRTSRASSPLGNNNNNNNHMTTRTTRTRSPSPARVQAKTPTRASSPMRAASPLHSLKNKLTKSKAVSKALEDESTNAAASVSEKSKEGSTHTSGCNSSPTKTSSSHGGSPPRRSKGRLRGRSPSPLHMLKPSGSKDTLENNDSNENTLDVDDERGTTISSTPSFSLGKTSFRSMSPSRLTKTLKSKLVSASPKWERPPQPKLPLHPGGSEDGTSKNSFDDGLDQIELRLGGTTMSFDVDDNKASEGDIEEENADVNVDELDIEENGCVINTTSFNIFERKEFLRAMGCGQVEATSTVVNYIQKGDALCEQGGEQLERAVQIYYAALGAVISRIREWTMERQQEERDSSIASGENDAPPVSLPTLSSLSYDDFVNAANCAEVNVLLIVMSTILLRTGNIHFRLRHFESACRDYSSAQSYQMLRTKAQSNHAIHESLMLEDAKLNGRIKNNMASALSKRQMFEEARVEYTKALQIKQNTLEALHKTTRENGESVKVVDDKHLVSDIASTFHNIGLLRLNCDEPVKAEKAFKQSLSLRVKKFGLDDLRVSSTLNALGGLYYQTKRYDDAFRSYKESLRIWKLNGGKSDLTTAEHYYNIGLVFYAKGPYSKAKVSVAECAKIRRQMCGNVSLPVAESLYLFGKISLSSGHYEEAFDKFQEALAIRQKLLGKDHLLVSNVHLPMGKVYHDMEEFDKAMSSFSIALAIRSDRLGKYNVSVAEVLHAIGSVYITLEEYSKALETLQEALRLQRNFLGPSLEVAETLNKMSLVFFKSGDTERAIELGEESLDILTSVAGFDHLLVAHVLKNVGDYYQYKEAYDDAMEAYSESLRIMALWLGREHILLSKTLSEVGVVRFKTGEYTIAKQSFMEALRIMRLPDNGTDNSSSIFPTLSHLGHALYKNNELKLAAESYLESFNIQASIVTGETIQDLDGFSKRISSIEDEILSLEQSGEDTSELSSALGGIANTLRYIALVNQAQGDSEKALNVNKLSLSVRLLQPFKEYSSIALMAETIAMFEFKLNNCARALDYFNQALTAKKAYQGDVTIDVARTVNNLANIHFSLGNLDEAMELYHEALEIKKSCLGEDSDDVVNTLKNIAQVMFKAGKEQEALQAYHNIVKIRQERYGKNHISVADTLASMGDVYIKLGELDVAKTYFEQSIKIQKTQEDGTFDERVLENLGSIYGKLGQWQKAESAFMELVQIKRTDHGSDFLGVARTLDLLAVSYIEQERSYESIEHLKEALRIRKVCLDADDDEVLASLNKLAFVYKSLDMTDEMQQMKAEFDAIQHGS